MASERELSETGTETQFIGVPMPKVPTLPLPPEGALHLYLAMEKYLPDEWQRWASAKADREMYRKELSTPPGGHRWPEEDPKRIAAIKDSRKATWRGLDAKMQTAWATLQAGLFGSLRSGALLAYSVPIAADDVYRLIPTATWQSLTKVSILNKQIVGLLVDPTMAVVTQGNDNRSLENRASGRPPAEARPLIEAEYKRRKQAGDGLSGAHEEASAILKALQIRHPELDFPQQQTVAKWIRSDWKEPK
jgi:hypothetical protein